MARVVVIGDVGGHLDALRAALRSVGVRQGRIPAGTTIVQVGDLIDRGPDTPGVLRLVARYLDEQPEQWVQVLGNHEWQYLPGGAHFQRERLSAGDARLLRSWWADGRMRVAAAVRREGGSEVLLSHAGLTADAWYLLGAPASAADAADGLNAPASPIGLGDGFTTGGLVRGPLWADAGSDLYEPWLRAHREGVDVPFDQVHGHSSVVSFDTRVWRCPGRVRQRATVDWRARHVRLRVGGRVFTGIDPKHGRCGAPRWQPLVLADARVLVPAGQPG
jgi:hypothetical protein